MWGNFNEEYVEYIDTCKICLDISGYSSEQLNGIYSKSEMKLIHSQMSFIPSLILSKSIPLIKDSFKKSFSVLEECIGESKYEVTNYIKSRLNDS